MELSRAHDFVDVQGFVRPKLIRNSVLFSLHTQIDSAINNSELDTIEVLIERHNFEVLMTFFAIFDILNGRHFVFHYPSVTVN